MWVAAKDTNDSSKVLASLRLIMQLLCLVTSQNMKLIVLFLAVLLQLSAADTLTSLDKAIQVLTGTQVLSHLLP